MTSNAFSLRSFSMADSEGSESQPSEYLETHKDCLFILFSICNSHAQKKQRKQFKDETWHRPGMLANPQTLKPLMKVNNSFGHSKVHEPMASGQVKCWGQNKRQFIDGLLVSNCMGWGNNGATHYSWPDCHFLSFCCTSCIKLWYPFFSMHRWIEDLT